MGDLHEHDGGSSGEHPPAPTTDEEVAFVADAPRFAPLVDGEDYFPAVRDALLSARRQVLVLGWEIHSEVPLVRGRAAEEAGPAPVRLHDVLRHAVERQPELEVRLLIWRGASLFAFERQLLPRMKRPWADHPRIRLEWDGDVPPLGSNHRKVVVVDDRIAFAGGMDLTKARWDSHEHRVDDPRRRTPGPLPGAGMPYHDLMALVDGPAAARLGASVRARWREATGESVEPPRTPEDHDPWPGRVRPLLRDRRVSVALTRPDHGDGPELRQVEASFLAQIRGAERCIFVETQYLASRVLTDALAERLGEADGPEVVIVLPYGCPGKVQAMAMDSLRDEMLERLRAAARGGRLGVYWPTLAGGAAEDVFDHAVYVHAKTMIVDDRLLRIGSANLNGRSMGLDTELDLWVEAGADEPAESAAIAGFRRRLLSHLLDRSPEEIRTAEEEAGSLVAAIERLRGGTRTLVPLDHRVEPAVRAAARRLGAVDPDRPPGREEAEEVLAAVTRAMRLRTRARRAVRGVLARAGRGGLRGPLLGAIAAVAVIAGVIALGRTVDPQAALDGLERVAQGPAGLAGMAVLFGILAAVGVPVTALVAGTTAFLGLGRGTATCVAGIALASSIGFLLGRWLRRRRGGDRPADSRLERLVRRLVRRIRDGGVVSVAVVRNLPVAPFAVVNVAFGVSGVGWGAYLVGTIAGMLPGVLLLGVFGDQLRGLLSDPSPERIALAGGAAAAAVLAAWLLRRLAGAWRGRRSDRGSDDATGPAAGEARA